MPEKSKITVILDSGGNKKILEISPEQSLLETLQQENIYIKSSCGGVASCGDCIIKVLLGADTLSAPGFDETKLLGNVFHITGERLSCQTKMLGNATIDISHHNKNKDQEEIKSRTGGMSTPSRFRHKVRKKKEVEAIKKEQLEKSRQEKQNPSWERHWEKKSSSIPPRKQAGHRRPRPFRTDHLDDDGDDKN